MADYILSRNTDHKLLNEHPGMSFLDAAERGDLLAMKTLWGHNLDPGKHSLPEWCTREHICDTLDMVVKNGHTDIVCFLTDNARLSRLEHKNALLSAFVARSYEAAAVLLALPDSHVDIYVLENAHVLCFVMMELSMDNHTKQRRDTLCYILSSLVQFGAGINRSKEVEAMLMGSLSIFNTRCAVMLNITYFLLKAGVVWSQRLRLRLMQLRLYYIEMGCFGMKARPEILSTMTECIKEMNRPKTLFISCRDAIRRQLFRATNGTEILSQIEKMQSYVPKDLLNALTLKDELGNNPFLSYFNPLKSTTNNIHVDNQCHWI